MDTTQVINDRIRMYSDYNTNIMYNHLAAVSSNYNTISNIINITNKAKFWELVNKGKFHCYCE